MNAAWNCASARGTWRIHENLDAFAEVLLGKSRAELIFAAPLSVSSSLRAWNHKAQSLDTISVALPKDHPNFPSSGSNVLTATLFDLGPRMKQDAVQFQRLLVGARGVAGGWDWDASLLQSSSRMRETAQNFGNRFEFERALKSGRYDFADPSKNSEAQREALRLSTLRPAEAELYAFDLNASTDLFQLPAGALGFAAGLQLRHKRMDSRTSDAVLSGTELRPAINIIQGPRRVSAAYAECNAPLLKTLTLNVAGRLDHYSDFGAAFSPKASLRYQPAAWLVLRGNVSRGFRAPSLPENTQSIGVSYGSVVAPRDPISLTVARGVTNLSSANPALKPERSRNVNFGFVVSPDAHTSVGVDYFNIQQSDLIDTETAKYIVDKESSLPGRIVRDEQGRIVSITRQFKNQGERTVSGFDIEASRNLALGAFGQIRLKAGVSRLLQFKAAPSEGAAPINGAGSNEFATLPAWRGVSSMNWAVGDWSSTLTWNYVGGYTQTYRPTQAYAQSVKPISTVDLNVDWQVSARLLATATLQNLRNSRLPWDASSGTFDGSQGDPRGRFLGLKVQYKF